MREDLQLIEDKLKDYMNNSNDYCLKKAMVYEICYQYVDMECESNYETKLNFDDILEIADIMVGSYFLNEMLCDMIQEKMKDYIEEKESDK